MFTLQRKKEGQEIEERKSVNKKKFGKRINYCAAQSGKIKLLARLNINDYIKVENDAG